MVGRLVVKTTFFQCSAVFHREVAVFSELRAFFSIGGEVFQPDHVSFR